MAHRWTEEHEAALAELYANGGTDESIAAALRAAEIVPTATRKSVELKRVALGLKREPHTEEVHASFREKKADPRLDPLVPMEDGIRGGDRFQRLTVPIKQGDRIIVIGDAQIPYHDAKSFLAVENFMEDYQPNVIVWIGDMFDFYNLSKYDQSPGRASNLQHELDIGHARQDHATRRHPNAKRVLIQGNHEDRLRRFIWEHQALASLRALDADSLFSRDGAWTQLPYGSQIRIASTMLEHGDVVRQKAGYSARALFEKRGTSVIMGHTHRLSQSSHRNALGQHTMIENGCLCRLDPEYGANPDWTQGFTTGYVNNGSVHWSAIPILVDGFRAENRFYRRDH